MNTNETFYSSISDHYWFAINKNVSAHWFIDSSGRSDNKYWKEDCGGVLVATPESFRLHILNCTFYFKSRRLLSR